MAIVNVTPDSFSGDGVPNPDAAIAYALDQHAAGADVLDVGGESTRPGHEPVDAGRESARVLPVVRALRQRLPHVPISIDTYKPEVARAAHAAGADIVNSVWGAPDDLLDVAAELAMPLIATHNRPNETADRGEVVATVLGFLSDCARRAAARGIARERVVLDPGIGFGKSADENLTLLRRLGELTALGHPTLLGVSRKSTIGKLTGRQPSDRAYGSVAAAALAVNAGIDVVRVHDVAAARDAVAVADAIVRDWRPEGWIG
jgi:dihydropteroate synthase